MPDTCQSLLAGLRRPRLLIDAGAHAATRYRRSRDLGPLLAPDTPGSGIGLIVALLAREAELEALRQAGSAAYAPARHVALVGAILAETTEADAGADAGSGASAGAGACTRHTASRSFAQRRA